MGSDLPRQDRPLPSAPSNCSGWISRLQGSWAEEIDRKLFQNIISHLHVPLIIFKVVLLCAGHKVRTYMVLEIVFNNSFIKKY